MAEEPTKKDKTPPAATPQIIQVASVTLADAMKGIGRDNLRNVVSGKQGVHEWTLTYLPHMRHHKIEYTNGSVTRTKFVHETRISDWEPA